MMKVGRPNETIGTDALIGLAIEEIPTPSLLLDLDALEFNIALLPKLTGLAGIGHLPHAKGHKSVEIAKRQMKAGAGGICCQKLSEAQCFISAGLSRVLITNELIDPKKIAKACMLSRAAAIILVADDLAGISLMDEVAGRNECVLDILIEIDLGQNRCGVATIEEALGLAQAINGSKNLNLRGIQAYQGKLQHVAGWKNRQKAIESASSVLSEYVSAFRSNGFCTDIVTGGGTGTLEADCELTVYTDVQPGSYVVMDAQYQVIGGRDAEAFELFRHALSVMSQVISVRHDRYVLDAGLKSMSSDAGSPQVVGCDNLAFAFAGDEHGILSGNRALKLGQKLKIIPGHCDTTINLYGAYVVHQAGRVVDIWPVDARGMIT